MKVSSMSEFKRKEEDLPSHVRIKQLKACWIKRIKCNRDGLERRKRKQPDIGYGLLGNQKYTIG